MTPFLILGSIIANMISVTKFTKTIVAVNKNIIAPANCWSLDLASASISNAPASVKIRIKETIGSALKILFKSKPMEFITGPSECLAG